MQIFGLPVPYYVHAWQVLAYNLILLRLLIEIIILYISYFRMHNTRTACHMILDIITIMHKVLNL